MNDSDQLRSIYKAVHIALCLILVVMNAWLFHHLLIRAAYEFAGPLTADSPIYLAVGRGILNGLLPYQDLFDIKPPGIFLISALSFYLFDSYLLGTLIQTVALPLYPLLMGSLIYLLLRAHPARWLYTLSASLICGIYSLYAAQRSGEYQVESFGALFAICYFFVALLPNINATFRIILSVFFLLCCFGMKEPFILVLIASAVILFLPDLEMLRSRFVYPTILALSIGTLILALWGVLHPFLTLYLPEILFEQIIKEKDAVSFLSTEGLGQALTIIARDIETFSKPALWMTTAILFSILFPWFYQRKLVAGTLMSLISLAAIALVIVSIGLKRDYFNHHFVFAVPFYIACTIAIMRFCASQKFGPLFLFPLILPGCTAMIQYPRYYFPSDSVQQNLRYSYDTANYIDNVLNSCHLERYLFIGGNGWEAYGFTSHSPMGPAFIQYAFYVKENRSFLRNSFIENMKHAPIIVVGDLNVLGDLRGWTVQELKQYYTETPPACASQIVKNNNYQFFYRKNFTYPMYLGNYSMF